MPHSRKQSANRQNAQKSTGPVTKRGKQASSMNALCHGLSSMKFRDPETEARIDALAKEFLGAGRADPTAMNFAREAAEAQITMQRIQILKKQAWGPNLSDIEIRYYGKLSNIDAYYSDAEFKSRRGYSKAFLRRVKPGLFAKPFTSDTEKKLAFDLAAVGRLGTLVRYERQFANRRDRALRALTKQLSSH